MAQSVGCISDDFAGDGVKIAQAPIGSVAGIERLDAEFREGKAAARQVKILGDNEDAGQIMHLEETGGILCGMPGGVALVVFKDGGGRKTVGFQVAAHDSGFVVAFFTMGAADKDLPEVALPIKSDGLIQSRLEHGGRLAVGFDLVAEDNSEIGWMEVVV